MSSNLHLIIFYIFLCIGCNTKTHSNEIIKEISTFDTTTNIANLTIQKIKIEDTSYNNLPVSALIDSIRFNFCEFQGIHNLKDLEFPFSYPRGQRYYKSNLPEELYKRIFNGLHEEHVEKGEHYFKFLLSMIEKENYCQFLFTTDGKYYPQVYLLTLDKINFKVQNEMIVFSNFQDVEDINIITTNFDENFDSFVTIIIKNNEKNYYKIDTFVNKYKILGSGKIIKK